MSSNIKFVFFVFFCCCTKINRRCRPLLQIQKHKDSSFFLLLLSSIRIVLLLYVRCAGGIKALQRKVLSWRNPRMQW